MWGEERVCISPRSPRQPLTGDRTAEYSPAEETQDSHQMGTCTQWRGNPPTEAHFIGECPDFREGEKEREREREREANC